MDQPHPLTSTSTGGLPALRGPSGGHLPVRPGFGLSAAIPTQPLVESSSRRIRTGRRAREEFDDEPPYGKVLGLTVGWFLIPALLFVAWRLLASTERTHDVGASVPWVLAAVGLSVIVAALLRWAIVGWRALTLSFAAAVIGSGVATIAHSLAA